MGFPHFENQIDTECHFLHSIYDFDSCLLLRYFLDFIHNFTKAPNIFFSPQ
jgi:hypothetical protein